MAMSAEQERIINAPLVPMSVIACAGSGKTQTAVRRIAQMRVLLGEDRGRVALLSFSNVAVDTFRRRYRTLIQEVGVRCASSRVEIDTLDGFITSNILRPHAYRTMGASQTAFLVTGTEPFLTAFTFRPGTYPVSITKMQVGMRDGSVYFYYTNNDNKEELNKTSSENLIHRLGKTGAYTHNIGRYWCYRTLVDQPAILRAFSRRYRHILIDEAQDIGTLHQGIIEQLVGAGTQVSLIGDPHQCIYEFADADGTFLKEYAQRDGTTERGLTRNYRSVPSILGLANQLASRTDTADRSAPETAHGAHFVAYKRAERQSLIKAFQAAVLAAGLKIGQSAVVCRGRELAEALAGNKGAPGQGSVQSLARAALLRDQGQDHLEAFKLVASCVVSLLANPPRGLLAMLTQPARYPDARHLRRRVWAFTRDSDGGLPGASLRAKSQWHPELLKRLKRLLEELHTHHGLQSANNLGNKLAKTGLLDTPLADTSVLASDTDVRIRIDTVHQVKGESLDAVLYITTKEHAAALLAGVDSEVGRIGYVAITRARDLLWLAVPANSLAELTPALVTRGFRPHDVALSQS
jgi:superfamily I DNA/RNA helicase